MTLCPELGSEMIVWRVADLQAHPAGTWIEVGRLHVSCAEAVKLLGNLVVEGPTHAGEGEGHGRCEYRRVQQLQPNW